MDDFGDGRTNGAIRRGEKGRRAAGTSPRAILNLRCKPRGPLNVQIREVSELSWRARPPILFLHYFTA